MEVGLRFRAALFCPGAHGFPVRGDLSFADRTNSSSRSFDTVRTLRMTSLKCWNSGVESNGSALILSPLGCGVSFRVPAVSGEEDASSILQILASEFLVCHSASNNLFQALRRNVWNPAPIDSCPAISWRQRDSDSL